MTDLSNPLQELLDVRVEALLVDSIRRQRLLEGAIAAAACIELVVGVDRRSGVRHVFTCHEASELQRLAFEGRAMVSSAAATPVPAGVDPRIAACAYGRAMARTVVRATRPTRPAARSLAVTCSNWWCEWLEQEAERADSGGIIKLTRDSQDGAPDILVCASATCAEVAQALNQVAHLGTVVVAGTYRDDAIEIPSYYQNIIVKESVILAIDRPEVALVLGAEEDAGSWAGRIRCGPSFERELRAACREATAPFFLVQLQ